MSFANTTLRSVLTAAALAALSVGTACAQGDQAPQAPPQGQDNGGGGGGRGGRFIERMMEADANHDGQITRAESSAAREAMFQRLDANHDGFITEDERPQRRGDGGGPPPGGPPPGGGGGGGGGGFGMRNADTNGDGKISHDEFTAQPNRGFDMMDADHNGVVTRAEIEAAQAAREARRNDGN